MTDANPEYFPPSEALMERVEYLQDLSKKLDVFWKKKNKTEQKGYAEELVKYFNGKKFAHSLDDNAKETLGIKTVEITFSSLFQKTMEEKEKIYMRRISLLRTIAPETKEAVMIFSNIQAELETKETMKEKILFLNQKIRKYSEKNEEKEKRNTLLRLKLWKQKEGLIQTLPSLQQKRIQMYNLFFDSLLILAQKNAELRKNIHTMKKYHKAFLAQSTETASRGIHEGDSDRKLQQIAKKAEKIPPKQKKYITILLGINAGVTDRILGHILSSENTTFLEALKAEEMTDLITMTKNLFGWQENMFSEEQEKPDSLSTSSDDHPRIEANGFLKRKLNDFRISASNTMHSERLYSAARETAFAAFSVEYKKIKKEIIMNILPKTKKISKEEQEIQEILGTETKTMQIGLQEVTIFKKLYETSETRIDLQFNKNSFEVHFMKEEGYIAPLTFLRF